MKRLLIFILTAVFIYGCKDDYNKKRTTIAQNPELANLAFKMDSIFNKGAIVGASTAIISKDEVLFSKAYGYADIGTDKKYSTHTLQNVGRFQKLLLVFRF